jgi:hypothetical protein
VGEPAELGELGDEGAGQVGSDAGDVSEEIVLRFPDGALPDSLVQVGIDVGQLPFEPADVLLDVLER